MAQVRVTIQRNADGTITIRVGKYIETVSITEKTKGELWDAVKYACITGGYNPTNEDLMQLLQKEL